MVSEKMFKIKDKIKENILKNSWMLNFDFPGFQILFSLDY